MAPSQKRILVVDDEKPMAKALELKLSKEGFLTKSVHNGEDALTTLGQDSYDLVLLDLVMPKLDGFKVLERMHAQKFTMPVFILSNLGQEEDRKRAKLLGAREFFIKSDIPIADVVSHIKQTLH
jgi:two-component system OmpR family response regulator